MLSPGPACDDFARRAKREARRTAYSERRARAGATCFVLGGPLKREQRAVNRGRASLVRVPTESSNSGRFTAQTSGFGQRMFEDLPPTVARKRG